MRITNETKIGLMVSAGIVLLAMLTIRTGNFNLSREGYIIKAHFDNVDGVNLNSPVMYNGFEVGIVEDIVIKEDHDDIKMELSLWINQKAKLRDGAKAYIKNLGFMGEKYIGLTSGEKGGRYLGEGSILEGEEPPDMEKILATGQDIAKRLKSISINIDERLETNKDAVDEILADLNVAMKDLASIVKNADERLTVNKDKIDNTVTNMHDLSVNLEELSYDLKMNPWKIMYRGKDKKKMKRAPMSDEEYSSQGDL